MRRSYSGRTDREATRLVASRLSTACPYFAVQDDFVHCNIRRTRYDPPIGHLLLPDAMPILDAVHLLPRRIRQSSPLPPPPGSGLFQFGVYARRCVPSDRSLRPAASSTLMCR